MLPIVRTAALLAALSCALPASATPHGHSGAYVSALAGNGSGASVGGAGSREAEIVRTDSYANEASARGVLSDGALHALAGAQINQPPTCRHTPSTCLPSKASAYAEIWDVLTFHREDLVDPSQIFWRFDIHGNESDGPLYGGTASARFSYQVSTRSGWAPTSFFTVNDGDLIRGSLQMTGEQMTVWFYAGMSVSASMGGWADYGNTVRFHLDLPPGVTYTSASGVFLADRPPIPPVPEPSSLALGLAGLASMAWVQRRRRGATRR